MFGLLVYDLRRLFPYLSMAVVAAAISALHVGIVGIVFPMIGAAWAVNGLSASDRQNGWAAFAVSSGIGRRDFVRARFSALMVFSVPLAVVPVACSLVMDPGLFNVAIAGLGIGTYLAGIGYAGMVTLSRPKDDVSLLRCITGQFVYLAVAVVALVTVFSLVPFVTFLPMIDIDGVGVQERDGIAHLFPALHEGGNGSDIVGGIEQALQRFDVPVHLVLPLLKVGEALLVVAHHGP